MSRYDEVSGLSVGEMLRDSARGVPGKEAARYRQRACGINSPACVCTIVRKCTVRYYQVAPEPIVDGAAVRLVTGECNNDVVRK